LDAILIKKSGERQAVILDFLTANVNVVSPDNTNIILSNLSYSALELSLGGNNNNLVFLSSANNTDSSIYFEASRKNIDRITQIELLADKAKKLRTQKNKSLNFGFALGFGCIALIAALIYFRGPIAGKMSFIIPFGAEKKIGDQIFNPKLTAEQKKAVDSLNELTAKLAFDPKIWPHPFRFHISSEMTPNAYATVGGNIFIHKGLIVGVTNADDLLGTIAHEMIHVQKRHVVKSIVQAVGIYSLLAFLVGDVSGLAAVLVDQGAPLLSLSYSRELEEEADQLGMDLMIANGISPSGLANSLDVIYSYHKKLVDQAPASEVLEKLQKIEILNSHPEIEKRIVNLRKQADLYKESKIFNPVDFDFESFQNTVKENF